MKNIENPKNKFAVYTCIFGDYDDLHEDYENEAPDFVDFYLITDREDIKTKYYKKIVVEVPDNNFHKTSRYYKINTHVLFSNYERVLYHDGSIKILNNKIKELFEETANYDFLAFHHHIRNCTYKEAKNCKIYAIEYSRIVNRQVAMLKKNHFKKKSRTFCRWFYIP